MKTNEEMFFSRMREAPEHIALCDLVESVQMRLESARPGDAEAETARLESLVRLEAIQAQLDRPRMESFNRTPTPSFDGQSLGLQSLHLVASEVLKILHAHPALPEHDPESSWVAYKVEDYMAHFSPEIHQRTIGEINAQNNVPDHVQKALLLGTYVLGERSGSPEAPGWDVERLLDIQERLASATKGEVISKPTHWERFDPTKVHVETHSLSTTQKEQTLSYGSPDDPDGMKRLGRFGAGVKLHPLQGGCAGGYVTTPSGVETAQNVYRMFHQGHPDRSLNLEPFCVATTEGVKASLREAFDRIEDHPVYADDPAVEALDLRFRAAIGEPLQRRGAEISTDGPAQ